jgi:hypothetical protein
MEPLPAANLMLRSQQRGFSATSQAEAFFYKWYPGSTFHPRSSSTGYTYEANGCISATSNAPFTTDLQVPDGARLIGVRFYFYDTVAASSLLFASNYDGLGDVDDLASAASTAQGATVRPTCLSLPTIPWIRITGHWPSIGIQS